MLSLIQKFTPTTYQLLQRKLGMTWPHPVPFKSALLQPRLFYHAPPPNEIIKKLNSLGREAQTNLLITAVRENDTNAVLVITSQAPYLVTSQNSHDNTALHEAAAKGNKAMVTLLCQNKADINILCHCILQRTPLHYAVQSGSVETVEECLANGADPNIQDEKKRTAVDYALERHNIAIAAILVSRGGQPNIQRELYNTLLPKITANLHAKNAEAQVDADIQDEAMQYAATLERSRHAKS